MKKILIVAALWCASYVCASAQEAYSKPLKEGDGTAKTALAVYIEVAPAKRDEFLKIMLELVKGSQSEDGCLEYTLWADLQSPDTFFLYEEYKDKDAFKAHQASAHFQDFVKKRDALGGVVMRGKVMDVASAVHKKKKQG